MDKSSSAKCLLYSEVVKEEPSPTGRGRRSRDDQGVGDIRFTNILQLFSIYFFFSITLLYHIFPILFLPTTFTHTNFHDPQHLATLLLKGHKVDFLCLKKRVQFYCEYLLVACFIVLCFNDQTSTFSLEVCTAELSQFVCKCRLVNSHN